VVAIDGSAQTRGVLAAAVGLARKLRARLVLLHVARPVELGAFDGRRTRSRAEAAARRAGEHLRNEAARQASDVVVARELHFGNPAKLICRRAKELQADLVVVGSRGLGTVDRLLLGSVSSTVASQASCSVLVVRAAAPKPT
jgi:nucleotide-binding universal stress UspA family protein